ncbi:MAG TPA: thiamine phosphate synthase [Acidimicrobiales bacterium]|nr:thiamine phosphate synthase [Acidimicrobiales bacterium]
MVVTDRRQAAAGGRTLAAVAAAAVRGGAAAVLLRERDLPPGERADLAATLRRVTARAGAGLVVAGDVRLARRAGADGVHLGGTDPWPGDPPTGPAGPGSGAAGVGMAVSRSCHTPGDLREARDRGAAWVTYSPVFATPSKPGYGPVLGIGGLASGCRSVPGLPVAALGGVDPTTAAACVAAGAAMVAMMGAVMRAADPEGVVAAAASAAGRAAPVRGPGGGAPAVARPEGHALAGGNGDRWARAGSGGRWG